MVSLTEKRCEGCGVALQTADPGQVGYIPEKALTQDVFLCRRCYRIRHYGETGSVEQDPDAYLKRLDEIAEKDCLVVLVTDLFDFEGSWIPGLSRRIGNRPLLVVANKLDLFPPSVKEGRLKEWVFQLMDEMGLHPADVVLCSAWKGLKINRVMQTIESLRKGRDVYLIGTTNVGKSTLINQLLKKAGRAKEEMITTSPYPGTTLDAIRIPQGDGKYLIDTPGIVRNDRMSEWVSPKELKKVLPSNTIKPRVYQLNEKQTLFFGGLSRFDFVRGKKQPFVCYLSNRLYIHRTKLEQADAIWEKHRGKLLSPPADLSTLLPLQKHVIHLKGTEKEDIVISGLGWIAAGREKAWIEVWAPEGIGVSTRPSII
ncbi:ribosome biogenesis GTPase YqeH [Thermoactinomyces sp. AMNI-1]|uniref:Ribosome biogenesis GTPase YqeH n=1 Tax=Thermoactinomyces mirandus TaxID=2756294 RepID=A0A7W1XPJ8_9BACL|nr:ribosome biogenesis GTPase YqeH [Thermoactinomyces mirandus]